MALKNAPFPLFYLLFIFITGCINVINKNADETTFKEVKINDLYSIRLPSYLKPSSIMLNEDASLQYSDTARNFYVIVIEEMRGSSDANHKSETLVEFFESCTSNIAGGLTEVQSSNPELIKVNGLDGYRTMIIDRKSVV